VAAEVNEHKDKQEAPDPLGMVTKVRKTQKWRKKGKPRMT
jgi:hypothetical protein